MLFEFCAKIEPLSVCGVSYVGVWHTLKVLIMFAIVLINNTIM